MLANLLINAVPYYKLLTYTVSSLGFYKGAIPSLQASYRYSPLITSKEPVNRILTNTVFITGFWPILTPHLKSTNRVSLSQASHKSVSQKKASLNTQSPLSRFPRLSQGAWRCCALPPSAWWRGRWWRSWERGRGGVCTTGDHLITPSSGAGAWRRESGASWGPSGLTPW